MKKNKTSKKLIHRNHIVQAFDIAAREHGIGFAPKTYGKSTAFHMLSEILSAQPEGDNFCDTEILLEYFNSLRTGLQENPGLQMLSEQVVALSATAEVDETIDEIEVLEAE